MLNRTQRSGFTLLELLIVVIIVGILASAALPQFTKMTTRAKTAEAYSALGDILTAESLYYVESNDTYATALSDLMVTLEQTKFTYGDFKVEAGPPKAVSVTATGTDAGPGTSVKVTGSIDSTGKRTFTKSGF